MASAKGAHIYESVRRRSLDPMRHRLRRAALLSVWLGLLMRVVVVGGLAFGAGFLGVILIRSIGWVVAGTDNGALVTTAAPVLV